ncbi:serine/threonine protein kinase [Fictibacillus iocasae]|uniref:Serine/threonine protein kinase n=1 Tax=Fictibacillus iocasae TaxID=2715437 RepID=A0ABW2NWE3_9BACL
MMNQGMDITKNPVCNLVRGERVCGKWHQNEYVIRRLLGHGATGAVYLAESKAGPAALKIGHDSMSIISEVNVLKAFSRVQGIVLGPSLIDVDDWNSTNSRFPFYVMEYLKGENVFEFLGGHGPEWLGIIMLQLINNLQKLHEAGWVFGDLKPDNLLVTGPPYQIRWIDVGGTTQLGRSVKEYTEFFDRGYWGLGSRVAEPSYDLFAAAMVMINTAYPARFQKKSEPSKQLQEAVRRSVKLQPYEKMLTKALHQKYKTAEEMKRDLLIALQPAGRPSMVKPSPKKTAAPKPKPVPPHNSRSVRRKKKRSWAVDTLLWLTFFFVLYFFYMIGQTM